MLSTTLLLKSTELEKTGLIEKDEEVTLYKIRHRASGQLHTLTVLHGSHNESIWRDIRQEFGIIQGLDHPNVLKCYEISAQNDGIHVLSESIASKSLRGSHIADESSLSDLTRQVLEALYHLHQRKIVHGDIRPSRIFFASTKLGCVKIVYFGRILQLLRPSDERHLHPERANSLDGFAGDLWSLGLCILELYLGSFPLDTEISALKLSHICDLSTASAEFRDFISCCLQKDMAKRWTAEQLLHHPFILQNSTGSNLRGDLMEEKTKLQQPFLSSSSSFSSSMTSKGIKLSESALQLSLEPENHQNGKIEVTAAVDEGKSAQKNIGSNKRRPGEFKRSISDQSLLVQRCAKRKRLKAKADLYAMPKELGVTYKNNASDKKEERIGDYSSTESEELEFRLENRMHFLEGAEDSRRIMQGADFDFESLPEHVRRCMQYCSLFPTSYELEKDQLVQLWIAEELIDVELTDRMEDAGKVCFDILASKGFIVPSSYDNLHRKQKYKVNESKILYWCQKAVLSRGHYLRIEDQLSVPSEMPLHLSLDMEEFDSLTFETLKIFKDLHTLLLLGDYGSSIKEIPRDLFLCLKSLYTLDLSRTQISELPSSVGCLESLHYLDLSYTPIKNLPESVGSLYSLQTLNLRGCFALHAVPEGISELINLRHFELDIIRQLNCMPRNMGNLRSLQTLKAFMVGRDDGCNIGELRNLNNIAGSFCIAGLENVANIDEASKAGLSMKQYLKKLELRWGDHRFDEASPEEEVLECLQPHNSIEELQIQFYKGKFFPSWIGNPLFTNVVSITLYRCIECQVLPSVGKLPSLKYLNIVGLDSVRDTNGLFCRNVTTGSQILFPKLEKLTLDNMPNLQQFTGAENGDFPSLVQVYIRYCPNLFEISSVFHLKVLQYLEISYCIKLQSVPEGGLPASIESLVITGCPGIKERCNKNGGEDWYKIAHIPSTWIDYEQISRNIVSVVHSVKHENESHFVNE
ncbi:putative disease resistance protein RGA4 [Coffea arabica]|uniref:Disease resistance protein RGA4 n=1 Tax=Coffea arabica TaxID=13443 RepID=A0A6P6SLK1_COFAR|nr:putative disease resistance protein At3g14460 [Coffea arabica]